MEESDGCSAVSAVQCGVEIQFVAFVTFTALQERKCFDELRGGEGGGSCLLFNGTGEGRQCGFGIRELVNCG